jgi:hypothetical protein
MNVVIFGASSLASLTWYVLTHDSPHDVVGFTVDPPYLVAPTKHQLPVVPFDKLETVFSPRETAFIAPVP